MEIQKKKKLKTLWAALREDIIFKMPLIRRYLETAIWKPRSNPGAGNRQADSESSCKTTSNEHRRQAAGGLHGTGTPSWPGYGNCYTFIGFQPEVRRQTVEQQLLGDMPGSTEHQPLYTHPPTHPLTALQRKEGSDAMIDLRIFSSPCEQSQPTSLATSIRLGARK